MMTSKINFVKRSGGPTPTQRSRGPAVASRRKMWTESDMDRPITRWEAYCRKSQADWDRAGRIFMAQLEKEVPLWKVAATEKQRLARLAESRKVVDARVSFAKVAKRLYRPSASCISVVPDLSKQEAQEDYRRAYRCALKQREEARSLIEAIKARSPRALRKAYFIGLAARKASEDLTRVIRQKIREIRRRPAKEVTEFPKACYFLRKNQAFKRTFSTIIPTSGEVKKLHSPFDCLGEKRMYWKDKTRQAKKESRGRVARAFETEVGVEFQKQKQDGQKSRDRTSQLDQGYVKFLLFKLHMRILSKRDPIRVENFYMRTLQDLMVKPQMEQAGQDMSEVIDIEHKENVVIQAAAPSETGFTNESSAGFSQYAVSKESKVFNKKTLDSYTNKWIRLDTLEWSTTDEVNKPIKEYKLPTYILQNRKSSQMAQMLFTNRFYRFDMKFKFVLNSSPWQTGLLICDWQYGPDGSPQRSQALTNTVYSAIQRNHVKLMAGSSNNAEMVVPYNFTNSYLTALDQLGYLTVQPLNRLQVVDKVATKATLTIFVALENFDGHGFISRDLGQLPTVLRGQMESIGALCNVGSNALRTVSGAFNRDKPPVPLQPQSLVPQTIPSFCYTDGIGEPINVLRSDPRGQRPSPIKTSEMALETLTRSWGFIETFEWRFADGPDGYLYSAPVAPLLPRVNYPQVSQTAGGIPMSILPPVAFIAAMTSKSRGNIEYRFEIVANAFYTGSLQISTVPLGDDTVNYQMDELILSATQILDIQKSSTLEISVPWNYKNAWMLNENIYKESEETYATIHVRVLNRLVAIESVPESVRINLYVRGGDNFEVTQLHTPIVGLPYWPIMLNADKYLKPDYPSPYAINGWHHELKSSGGRYMQVLDHSDVGGDWYGFMNVKPFHIYELETTNKLRPWRLWMNGREVERVKYAVHHPILTNGKFKGVVLCISLEAAKDFIDMVARNTFSGEILQAYLEKYPAQDYVSEHEAEVLENGKWVVPSVTDRQDFPMFADTGKYPLSELRVRKLADQAKQLVIDQAIGQMDKESYSIKTEELAPLTSYGLSTFGESLGDLKSIARRWQHYGSFSGKTSTEISPRDAPAACLFSVMPWRFLNVMLSTDYDNRIRDGSVALLNNMFAFWSGGMRFRVVLTSDTPPSTVVYIQHRFDDPVQYKGIVPGTGGRDNFMDPHYPTVVQAMSVNPTVSFEVSYMRSEERLYTYANDKGHNGSVGIWIHSPTPGNITFDVYYCVADDFEWSTFQGTPAIFDLDLVNPSPQMNTSGELMWDDFIPEFDAQDTRSEINNSSLLRNRSTHRSFDSVVSEPKPGLTCFFEEEPERSQLFGLGTIKRALSDKMDQVIDDVKDGIVHKVTESYTARDDFELTIKNVGESAVKIAKAAEDTTHIFEDVSKKMSDFVDNIQGLPSELSEAQKERMLASGSKGLIADYAGAAFDYVTHLVYCIIHPQASTISWAIVNLYRNVYGFTVAGFEKLISPISNLWSKMTQPKERIQVVGQMEDTDISSLCQVLYCTMCTTLKIVTEPPRDWKDIAKGLFNFSNTTRGSSYVGMFIRDNITLLKRIWRKIVSIFSVGSNNYKLIAGIEDKRIQNWCVHANAILNPSMRETVLTSPLWAEKVFELALAGRAIFLTVSLDKTTPGPLLKLISDNLNAIKKLEAELVNRNVFCGERYEPFCLWAFGGAGAGKTRCLQDVATDLADLMKVPAAQTYHTITIQQAYFDGYIGQPSILIDDFLTASPLTDPTAHMFVQMKSSALFNPPYSDVKDKCKMVNFYNLLVTSNRSGVDGLAGIHDTDAYHRRRDLLLEFELKDKEKYARKEYTLEQYQRLEQARVWYHPNPLKPGDRKELIDEVPGEDYSKTISKFILKKAMAYHTTEAQSFQKRCKDKIARLEKYTEAKSVEEYLQKAVDIFAEPGKIPKPTDIDFWRPISMFTEWLNPQVEEVPVSTVPSIEGIAEVVLEEIKEAQDAMDKIVGQMDPEPSTSVENYSDAEEWLIQEPKPRPAFWGKVKWGECLHAIVKDVYQYEYQADYDCFEYINDFCDDMSITPYSLPAGPCTYCDHEGKRQIHPKCIMTDFKLKYTFMTRVVNNWIESLSEGSETFPDLQGRTTFSSMVAPDNYITAVARKCSANIDRVTLIENNAKLRSRVDRLQERLRVEVTDIDGIVVPKESRWKRISKAVWHGFLKVCRLIVKTFKGLHAVVDMLLGLSCVGAMGGIAYSLFTTPGVVPQIHASGDYKTVKQASAMKTKALILSKVEGQNLKDSEIYGACKELYFNPDSDGRLRRIIKNVFTLVGMAPRGDQVIVYRVRCIGLFNYKFLCLKHYIDHFRSRGVTDVAIVYHKLKGLHRFKMTDIKFQWTEGGYGLGEFPTLPMTFGDITKYIPSEKFNGNYPLNMKMVEVSPDGMEMFDLQCTSLKQPKFIAENDGQEAWTIQSGFTYRWGGEGRCGSFLFAPQLATPLVAIHSAGMGDLVGYSETILRETFITPEEEKQVYDYTTPQMSYNAEGFQLPDYGYEVGHLPKDKAIHLPNKTKIVPSVIAGVFEVKTYPAPLAKGDPRLPEGCDPLMEGIRKRCDPPLELPIEFIEESTQDLINVLQVNATPLREPEVLSVAQSIEGLAMEGYEPMRVSTSEGYPWVKHRPDGCTDKSWLFKFEEYADKRRKVVGIHRLLSDVLELKENMRARNIVPATYYTACLKDARIAKDKMFTPGKTRLFEMSPVDLTIAQRQYFLDFYAAYTSRQRFECENTIGINPDGIEWTELATRLIEFSPYILTADYSGYGPRLPMTIQSRCYDTHIAWYQYWEDKLGFSEEYKKETNVKRKSLKMEMLHPLNVVKDLVCYFSTGMPSGNAGTVIINSTCNSILIRVVYLILATKYKPEYADMYWFHTFVLLFSNGDDLIMSVKADIIQWFNNKTIIDAFADFNIKMTDAMKSGQVREYCSIEEATYLKRGFLPHPTRKGHWLAPLEEASITDTANWIEKGPDMIGASMVNSEMCCRLAYTRGPKFYDEICEAIRTVWKSQGFIFRVPSWKSLDAHVWEGTEGPRFQFS